MQGGSSVIVFEESWFNSDRVAVRLHEHEKSYRDLFRDIQYAVQDLKEYDVCEGDFVAFRSSNAYEIWVYALACLELSCIFVPQDPNLGAAWLRYQLSQLPKKAITLSKARLEGCTHLVKLSKMFRSEVWAKPWYIVFTSGSSGPPKAVLHSFQSLGMAALSSLSFYQFKPEDCWVQSLSLVHVGGLMTCLRPLLGRGSVLILGGGKKLLERLRYVKFDFISLVPTQLQDCLNDRSLSEAVQSCKAVLVGGASCSQGLVDESLQHEIPISVTYGSSETGGQVCASYPGEVLYGEADVGRILPGRSISIIDKRLMVKGPDVYLGYFRSGVFESSQGIFHTFDIGSINSNRVSLFGRSDRVFQCGGENISPDEICRQLGKGFAGTFFCMPLAHERLGAVVQLVIRQASYPDLGKLLGYIKDHFPRFQQARRIYWDSRVGLESKLKQNEYLKMIESGSLRLLWEENV